MSSIGQKDVALTPLQNAMVAATIANGGRDDAALPGRRTCKGPTWPTSATTAPHELRRAVSPQVAATATELMIGAEKVTQQKGAIPGVQIASKTGTAEHGTDPRQHPAARLVHRLRARPRPPRWPSRSLVENGGDRLSATGGALAAPIGRAVIAAALQEAIMSARVGVTLSGRYRLQRLIATGGMGQVWEARRQPAGPPGRGQGAQGRVLLRPRVHRAVPRRGPHHRDAQPSRHRQRATTTARPRLDGEGRTAYLVMELVNGEPLNSVLKRTGRLSLRHALDMLEQTGRALQVAHTAGLVHRDVKPGNILITPTGQVKITDFGIAKAVDAAPVTQTGMVMGTAQYIAPEQALGQDATAASDVYSLGVVGYEVAFGHAAVHRRRRADRRDEAHQGAAAAAAGRPAAQRARAHRDHAGQEPGHALPQRRPVRRRGRRGARRPPAAAAQPGAAASAGPRRPRSRRRAARPAPAADAGRPPAAAAAPGRTTGSHRTAAAAAHLLRRASGRCCGPPGCSARWRSSSRC